MEKKQIRGFISKLTTDSGIAGVERQRVAKETVIGVARLKIHRDEYCFDQRVTGPMDLK